MGATMVNNCANPTCSASFRNLRDGRVFVIEAKADSRGGDGHSRQLRYFWLCNACCRTMTVVVEKRGGIKIEPLPASAAATPAAS
jgi:hypothetical protein